MRSSHAEWIEGGYYKVCTAEGHCQTVSGLQRANDVMDWHESQRH